MLPVSAWPPGPPGASLSPFGAPRTVNVGSCGFVLPKGAWIVVTTSNQVVMYRPSWEWELYNQPNRQPGTGILPGDYQWRYGPKPPTCPQGPTVYRVKAQVWRDAPTSAAQRAGAAAAAARSVSRETIPEAKGPKGVGGATVREDAPPQQYGCAPPPPPIRLTHDQFLEQWRAWQRRIGRTDPPIMPIPGRVPPNWAGWKFVNAPASTLVPMQSSGLVLADGQNVVIVGVGCATVTEAYSV